MEGSIDVACEKFKGESCVCVFQKHCETGVFEMEFHV